MGNLFKYLPFLYDGGFMLVTCAAYAVWVEPVATQPGQTPAPIPGPEKKNEAVTAIREQIAKPGGLDLPEQWNSPFVIGLFVDVAVKLLNLVGVSRFFKSLNIGSAS